MNTGRITGSFAGALDREAAIYSRRTAWLWEVGAIGLILLWVTASLLLVYRVPQQVEADFGSSYGRAYLRGNVADAERNEQYTYAWVGDQADIMLPGAGGGWFALDVWFSGWRPDGVEASRLRFGADNAALLLAPPPVLRAYHVLTPSRNGDLIVPVLANAFTGPGRPRDGRSARPRRRRSA